MAQVKTLERLFIFEFREYPDPDPEASPEEVRQLLAKSNPDFTNGSFSEPKARGNKLVYQFNQSVGRKG